MATKTAYLTGVTKADVIERVVARCIADKVWRSECETEVCGYASKAERPMVLTYVRSAYDAAGAGFRGRWQ